MKRRLADCQTSNESDETSSSPTWVAGNKKLTLAPDGLMLVTRPKHRRLYKSSSQTAPHLGMFRAFSLLRNPNYFHSKTQSQFDVSPDGRYIGFQTPQVLQENIGIIDNL